MKNVTVRLSEEYVETLDAEAADAGMSRAEYIRDLIEKGRDADATQRELEATQAKVENLQRQLRARNAREADVSELVEYVEREREMQREQREIERRRRSAGVLTRTKWWLGGMSDDDPADPDG